MFEFDEDGEEWGFWEGECLGCDVWGRVDDLGLCEDCSPKLERDMIRQRAWDYAATTWGLEREACEEVRRQVIAQYGEALELIAEEKPPRRHRAGGKHRKQRPR